MTIHPAQSPHFTADALDLILHRIRELELDLSGLNIVTEAATGAYACTPTIAALAGAKHVHAVTRDTRYGSFDDARTASLSLAQEAGVADRITVAPNLPPDVAAECDILTNSGHLRPINAGLIAALPPTAVIGLMFEAWEFREQDLDLALCMSRGIRIAGVNERHPSVGVFDFLGPLCLRLLDREGFSPVGRRIALVCDNPFAPFLETGLSSASLTTFDDIDLVPADAWDAVVVAINPARNRPISRQSLARLSEAAPNALLAQFWGDIDDDHGWSGPLCPRHRPAPGHMAILLNELGPDPIIRLQTGGLRAAEIVFRGQPLNGLAEILTADQSTIQAR